MPISEWAKEVNEKHEQQQKEISRARKVLKSIPYKTGVTMPAWIRKAYKKHRKELIQAGFRSGYDHRYDKADYYLVSHRTGWLDHVGKYKTKDGKWIVVSEPYGLSLESHQQLEKFCDIMQINYAVRPNGYHFPGSTFRIELFEKNET